MLTDHRHRIGILIRRCPGEQMKRRGRQRILVGAPVKVIAHQLLGSGVGHRPDRQIGRREPVGVG